MFLQNQEKHDNREKHEKKKIKKINWIIENFLYFLTIWLTFDGNVVIIKKRKYKLSLGDCETNK